MASQPDPASHQSDERQMIEHALRVIDDPRMVIDTVAGRRSITALLRDASRTDRGVDMKRAMSELNVPDRALQEQMPIGESLDVSIKQRRFFLFSRTVAHVRIACISPTRELITGTPGHALGSKEVEAFLRQLPPPVAKVPMTIVLVSTGGFTIESRELAQRVATRTLILAEPNGAGGWSIYGPPETKALSDLLDPEDEAEKRRRIRDEIESAKLELLTSGIASDRIAHRTALPLQVVEAEVRSYAKANPGLAAKRLDGRIVLYREGSAPLSGNLSGKGSTSSASGAGSSLSELAGGLAMPLIDRIRALFSRKGETDKKIAFLSERRAALSQQRDRAYEDISALEAKDDELREQFKSARAPLTKRRVTSQLVQLRKDIERRQQMIQVLNQQVNVVSTHLHNLELTKQGEHAQLPDSEEIATDAAAAEEMIAQLQADSELADSVAGVAMAGMSDEEQALYEELERENSDDAAPSVDKINLDHAELPDIDAPAKSESTRSAPKAQPNRRAEPEAG